MGLKSKINKVARYVSKPTRLTKIILGGDFSNVKKDTQRVGNLVSSNAKQVARGAKRASTPGRMVGKALRGPLGLNRGTLASTIATTKKSIASKPPSVGRGMLKREFTPSTRRKRGLQ